MAALLCTTLVPSARIEAQRVHNLEIGNAHGYFVTRALSYAHNTSHPNPESSELTPFPIVDWNRVSEDLSQELTLTSWVPLFPLSSTQKQHTIVTHLLTAEVIRSDGESQDMGVYLEVTPSGTEKPVALGWLIERETLEGSHFSAGLRPTQRNGYSGLLSEEHVIGVIQIIAKQIPPGTELRIQGPRTRLTMRKLKDFRFVKTLRTPNEDGTTSEEHVFFRKPNDTDSSPEPAEGDLMLTFLATPGSPISDHELSRLEQLRVMPTTSSGTVHPTHEREDRLHTVSRWFEFLTEKKGDGYSFRVQPASDIAGLVTPYAYGSVSRETSLGVRRVTVHVNEHLGMDTASERMLRVHTTAAILASAEVGSLFALPINPAFQPTLLHLGYTPSGALDDNHEVWKREHVPAESMVSRPPDEDAVRH